MPFPNLPIKSEYRTLHDNIIQEFYLPALEKSVSYRRSVGFFSSSALVELSQGICGLAKNGGKIELVASPCLSAEDEKAIRAGYENRARIIENALLRSLNSVGENHFEKERLNLLATLIEKGVLDIKIAFTENGTSVGIYHEKLGLLEDSDGNKIAFTGSMNETEYALRKNYEAVDVFCSWKGDGENERVLKKEEAFAKIWGNFDESLKVQPFPAVNKAILEKYKWGPADFDLDKKEFKEDKASVQSDFQFKVNNPSWLDLRPYQKEAIAQWEKKNFVGIYDLATGTGKTLTALASLTLLYHKLNGEFCSIILCPYIHLVMQWVEDIEKFGIKPIIAFGTSPQEDWKEKLKKAVERQKHQSGEKCFFCLVSSISTFKSKYVQKKISEIKKPVLLIADEAHNLGSQNSLKYLDEKRYEYRLALSATLERHFDKLGTKGLFEFFGEKCIEYGLENAIKDGYLTPYKYYPIVTALNFEERRKYCDLSEDIRREVREDASGAIDFTEKGKKLLIQRARIVAGAASKKNALIRAIEPYAKSNNILIYCGATKVYKDEDDSDSNMDSIRQIEEIVSTLHETYKMKISRFTAEKKSEERETIIDNFKQGKIQAIAAIKCLDEGVNIPSIETAFILASSTNSKEYIQRRGRVLRLSEGKKEAEIFDFVCLPDELTTLHNKTLAELEDFKSLVKNEISRLHEFARLSKNPQEGENLAFELENLFQISKNVNIKEIVYDF